MGSGSGITAERLAGPGIGLRRPATVLAVNDAIVIGATHRFRGMDAARRPATTGFEDITSVPGGEVRVPATLRLRRWCGCGDRIGSS